MTHSQAKAIVRQRMLYTGEGYQQACLAMKRDGRKLPSADSEEQRLLEAAIMIALAGHGGSSRGWMPKSRWWSDVTPLTICRVQPTSARIELSIPDDLLPAFYWAVMPEDASVSSPEGRGVPGLYDVAVRGGVELRRSQTSAAVTVRTTSTRWNAAGRAARDIPCPFDVGFSRGYLTNPRWARNDAECRDASLSLVASELLRRAALFFDRASASWVTRWSDIYLQGPLWMSEWLPDPVPIDLATMLTDTRFGIRILKTVLDPDYTVHQYTKHPAFMTGLAYEDMIRAR
ncbi:hypothetical protein ACWDV4_16185 [Micromonospora sp. NPDC003197]